LQDVTVTGNVTVGTGATLDIGGIALIGGNIEATQCAKVFMESFGGPILIGGNVQIQQCTANSGYVGSFSQATTFPILIAGNFECSNNSAACDAIGGSVGGNVTIDNNSGKDFLGFNSIVFGNSVVGNVEFDNNSGTATSSIVGFDTIKGNLRCQGNTPGVINDGEPNQVVGTEQGQCSGL
jgi:hypothetical protein